MKFNKSLVGYLNHALNESTITDFSIDRKLSNVSVVFETVIKSTGESIPIDSRVVFKFGNVCRVASQLKIGEWNDYKAEVKVFEPDELANEIVNLDGDCMYGWEFINVKKSEKDFEKWKNKTSFDLVISELSKEVNTIDIYSEHLGDEPKTLNLRIWFEDLNIALIDGAPISFHEFINRGIRFWNEVFGSNSALTTEIGLADLSNNKQRKSIFNRLKNKFRKKD